MIKWDFSLLVNYFPAIKLKQWVQNTGKWHPNYYWTQNTTPTCQSFFLAKRVSFLLFYTLGDQKGAFVKIVNKNYYFLVKKDCPKLDLVNYFEIRNTITISKVKLYLLNLIFRIPTWYLVKKVLTRNHHKSNLKFLEINSYNEILYK